MFHTVGSWTAGKYDPEGSLGEPIFGPGMGPVWIEQHGSAAAVDSTVDSLRYDGWERLLAWRQYRKTPPDTAFTLAASDSVGFDRAGNVTVSGETRWHDPITNRLDSLVAGTWTWRYTYDAAGQLTRAVGTKAGATEDWRYSYDALGQLRRVGYKAVGWPADSTVARYGYDVLGRRIAKRVYRVVLSGSTPGYRRFVYHGDQVAYETDSSGTVKMKYAWGTGVDDLMGVEDSTGTFYHVVQDQLGSVRGLVKRDGTWRMHQRFTPYGTLLARDSAGALPPLRTGWTGREYDAESGLYFFRARYYDPRQRRFTQEDPIGYGGGGNLYAYVGGAVLEARDPSGLYRDCYFGACGNPHDWSGIPGLDAGGGSVNDGGGYNGLGSSALEQWAEGVQERFAAWLDYKEYRNQLEQRIATGGQLPGQDGQYWRTVTVMSFNTFSEIHIQYACSVTTLGLAVLGALREGLVGISESIIRAQTAWAQERYGPDITTVSALGSGALGGMIFLGWQARDSDPAYWVGHEAAHTVLGHSGLAADRDQLFSREDAANALVHRELGRGPFPPRKP